MDTTQGNHCRECEEYAHNIYKLESKVRAADYVMEEIDRMVQIGKLNSRSGIADRRLCYSEPFEYENRDEELIAKDDALTAAQARIAHLEKLKDKCIAEHLKDCKEYSDIVEAQNARIAELEGEKESLVDALEKAYGLIPTWRERGRVVNLRNGHGAYAIECADELSAALKETDPCN